jgi:hypothetical protein
MESTGQLSQDHSRSRQGLDGMVATRDHAVIQRWAEVRHAEPATGQATRSGPATIDANDGGSVVRFNFPGAARFRPITWEEWFKTFDEYQQVFVYKEPLTDPRSALYRIEKMET